MGMETLKRKCSIGNSKKMSLRQAPAVSHAKRFNGELVSIKKNQHAKLLPEENLVTKFNSKGEKPEKLQPDKPSMLLRNAGSFPPCVA